MPPGWLYFSANKLQNEFLGATNRAAAEIIIIGREMTIRPLTLKRPNGGGGAGVVGNKGVDTESPKFRLRCLKTFV